MTWFASSANQTESEAEHAHLFIAVDLDFPSGHVRLWSGSGEITINGDVFQGAGALGKVSAATERAVLDATRKTFQLSGVEPSLVPEADIDACFGRSVIEYFGFLDKTTLQLVDDPEVHWEGRLDNVQRTDGAEPAIAVNAEHKMVLLDQADGWRNTHEHQQQFYPGDNGFNLVGAIQLRKLIWGGLDLAPGVYWSGVPGYAGWGNSGTPYG